MEHTANAASLYSSSGSQEIPTIYKTWSSLMKYKRENKSQTWEKHFRIDLWLFLLFKSYKGHISVS